MKRERKKRYRQLREIRQERDYHSGKLQFANRPISKPSLRTYWIDGKLRPAYVTTKEFIKRNNIKINA